jgi:hypothetical protein
MAWWSNVNGDVKKHDGPRPKFGALVRLSFARAGGTPEEALGLYKRDPARHEGEPNLLPGELEKVRKADLARQIKQIMGKGKRK